MIHPLRVRLLGAVHRLLGLGLGPVRGGAVLPAASSVATAGADARDKPGHLRPTPSPVALRVLSPREQALRLLAWLQGDVAGTEIEASEVFSGPMLARDVQRQYREMAAELGWAEQPWRLVGHELALATSGGVKKWSWVSDPQTGARHRLRVYVMPSPRPRAVKALRKSPTPVAARPTPPTPLAHLGRAA